MWWWAVSRLACGLATPQGLLIHSFPGQALRMGSSDKWMAIIIRLIFANTDGLVCAMKFVPPVGGARIAFNLAVKLQHDQQYSAPLP